MARTAVTGEGGFSFNKTDVAGHLVIGRNDGCNDSLAWLDIDGDGQLDFIGIESAAANREDEDHDLVAVHGPSGSVMWRGLTGEVSDALAVCDGVLICATDDRSTLRGLDPRNGQQLWKVALPDSLSADPFDGPDNCHTITARGPFALFETEDNTCHVMEARTGRVVFHKRGKFEWFACELPGLVCVMTEDADGDTCLELIDLFRGRCVYLSKCINRPTLGVAPGMFAVMHGGINKGPAMIKLVFFDGNTYDQRGEEWIKKPGGESGMLSHGAFAHDRKSGLIIPGNRFICGDRASGQIHVLPMTGGTVSPMGTLQPPQPGFLFRDLAVVGGVICATYEKDEGTKKLILMGYDLSTLAARWWIPEGLGGVHTLNSLLVTPTAVLVPSARRKETEYNAQNNPTAWWHIDPTTGTKVTEYPTADLDCVELVGKYFCGFVDVYYHGQPYAYDTERRERVL